MNKEIDKIKEDIEELKKQIQLIKNYLQRFHDLNKGNSIIIQ